MKAEIIPVPERAAVLMKFSHSKGEKSWESQEEYSLRDLQDLGYDGSSKSLELIVKQRMRERKQAPDFRLLFASRKATSLPASRVFEDTDA